MNENFQQTLDKLNADYTQIKGQPFSHFFCPMLFRDENVLLCEAHIINQAFPDVPSDWTIQREDIDKFYGSIFEADFVATQYGDKTHGDILADKKLSKLFKSQILVEDKPVDFYLPNPNNEVPKDFTQFQIDNNGQIIQLVLKISPEELESAKNKKWEMSFSKDMRV